ncbi:MAG: hypothetical protein WC456_01680 [Patescibacteria group bacterium]
MRYQRLIPVIAPLLVWLLSQALLWEPRFFYSSLALGVLVIALSVRYLALKNKIFWLPFILPPALLFLSFISYIAIIVGNFWIQSIGVLLVYLLFLYFRNLYYYFASGAEQPEWSLRLDNLLMSSGFLSAFTAAAFLFNLSTFTNWPIYFLLPSLAVLSGLLFWQFRLVPHPDNVPRSIWLPLLSVLALTELAAAFALLPLNFNILALFFAIAYYLGLILIRLSEGSNLRRRTIKLPLILSAIVILLLLLTSRWL